MTDHKIKRAKIGVLLVNLGTPDKPTTLSVMKYLRQFLSDRRVIEVPKVIWFFILNFIILPFRSRKSAEKYAKIWKDDSPLRTITSNITNKVSDKVNNKNYLLKYAMRYGNPSIEKQLQELLDKNCEFILIFPLFPQYSATTSASIFDEVARIISKRRNIPHISFLKHFHDHDCYIESIANHLNEFWENNRKGEKLILSYHGIPNKYFSKGDVYHCFCHKTSRLIKEKLNLKDKEILTTFQSRLGPSKWLTPYTDETLVTLANNKIENVDIFSPGFASDCLETIEELGIENRENFLKNGGKNYNLIPCLNDSKYFISAISKIIIENTSHWNSRFDNNTDSNIKKSNEVANSYISHK
jgi:ferrochelatase